MLTSGESMLTRIDHLQTSIPLVSQHSTSSLLHEDRMDRFFNSQPYADFINIPFRRVSSLYSSLTTGNNNEASTHSETGMPFWEQLLVNVWRFSLSTYSCGNSEEDYWNEENTLARMREDGMQLQFFPFAGFNENFSNFENSYDSRVNYRDFGNNRLIVQTAVRQNGLALQFAPADLRRDLNVCLTAVTQNPEALRFVENQLVMDEALSHDGLALRNIREQNSDLVYTAVRQNGLVLKFADDSTRQNPRIIQAAVRQNEESFIYSFSPNAGHAYELGIDNDFLLDLVAQNPRVFRYLPQAFREDPEFVIAAIQQDESILHHLNPAYSSFASREERSYLLGQIRSRHLSLANLATDTFSNRDIYLHDFQIIWEALGNNGLDFQFVSEDLRRNPQLALRAIEQNPLALSFIPEELRYDSDFVRETAACNHETLRYIENREIVTEVLRRDGLAIRYLPLSWREDPELVQTAVSQNGNALYLVNSSFRENADIALAAVTQNGLILEILPEVFQNNPEIVRAAVQQNGMALQYAGESLRSDETIVQAAVTQNGWAIRYADQSFLQNDAMTLAAARQNGLIICLLPTPWQRWLGSQRDIMENAVRQNGLALRYASEDLKKNFSLVLNAVRQNGRAIRYADDSLKNNIDIVRAAVNQDGTALEFASDELRANESIVRDAVHQNGLALEHANQSLQANPEIALAAIHQNGEALCSTDRSLRTRDVVMEAVSNNGEALRCVYDNIHDDLEIVKTAIHEDPSAFVFMPARLMNNRSLEMLEAQRGGSAFWIRNVRRTVPAIFRDQEIMSEVIPQNPQLLMFAPNAIQDDEAIVSSVISIRGCSLQDASNRLRGNLSIVRAAVQQDGLALQYASSELKNNPQLVLEAVTNNGAALQFAAPALRRDPDFQRQCFERSFYSYHYMKHPVPELTERYEEILRNLQRLHIDFLDRFADATPDEIQEIITNRTNIVPDARPLAMVLYTKARHGWSDSFSYIDSHVTELIRHGYRVVYTEIEYSDEIPPLIERYGQLQVVDLLVIAGHGSPHVTELGRAPTNQHAINELFGMRTLDLNDENSLRSISQYMRQDSVVLLVSCSTARHEGYPNNLANMVSRIFPNSTLFASTRTTSSESYSFDESGRVMGIQFPCHGTPRYSGDSRCTAVLRNGAEELLDDN